MTAIVAQPTIVYDDDCGFCRWTLAQLLTWDRRGRLRLVALQEPEADVLLAGVGEAERMASAHLVLEDGTVLSGGRGAARVAELLPGGAPLAFVAGALGDEAVDRAYRAVADRRTTFGRFVRPGWKQWADSVIARRRARQAPPVASSIFNAATSAAASRSERATK
jgi:predicted DCC family thiol-disulfide oxidoreductase YuxK